MLEDECQLPFFFYPCDGLIFCVVFLFLLTSVSRFFKTIAYVPYTMFIAANQWRNSLFAFHCYYLHILVKFQNFWSQYKHENSGRRWEKAW